jgi:hypothetical protein
MSAQVWTEADLARSGYVIENGRAVRKSAQFVAATVAVAPAIEPGAACEEDVQRSIITGLTAAGYRVLQTSRRYRPCQHCGKVDHRGDGATQGVPDLLVCHDDWPVAVMAAIECKGPTTRVSDAQKQLDAAGRIVVVRSYAAALAAVERINERVAKAATEFTHLRQNSKKCLVILVKL